MRKSYPNSIRLTAVSLSVLLTVGCSLTSKIPTLDRQSTAGAATKSVASANDSGATDSDQNRVQRHIYAGVGFGSSWMEPDTSEAPNIEVAETNDTGAQFTLGMDLSKHGALELHSTNLGSATLSPQGSIGYKTHGASALLYVGKNRHNYKRRGFSGYARLGYALLQNTADEGIVYEQKNASHVLVGAGLEFMTKSGIGLRLETIAFEQDARNTQLGLIYRTGKKQQQEPVEPITPVNTVAATPEPPKPVIAEEPIVGPVLTRQQRAISVCNSFNGTLQGVNFLNDSDQLTPEANRVLADVSAKLKECPSVPIRVSAHTDNVGDESSNQTLSKKRAVSVIRFFVANGVDIKRIQARAFGETQPIASNDTEEGRAKNRRVELTAQ